MVFLACLAFTCKFSEWRWHCVGLRDAHFNSLCDQQIAFGSLGLNAWIVAQPRSASPRIVEVREVIIDTFSVASYRLRN